MTANMTATAATVCEQLGTLADVRGPQLPRGKGGISTVDWQYRVRIA